MSYMTMIITAAVAFVVALVSLPWLIRLGHRYALLDQPHQHKRHGYPTPFLGGLALFVSVWIAIAVGGLLYPATFTDLGSSWPYIFAAALIIVLVGLSDDLKPLSAGTKLLAQVAAALLVYTGGVRVELLSTPWGSLAIGNWSLFITVLWVVGLTNAINIIDGLDALAGGVSLIGAVTLLFLGQLYDAGGWLAFVTAMVGFLLVFLYYNRPPARIFLGDSGAMQLGFYFAVFSLSVSVKSYAVAALYLPLLALGVPILETLSSTIRRLASGRKVYKADRRHLFHYLSVLGLSRGQVILVFYVLQLVFGGFALAAYYWNRLIVFGFLLVFMVVVLTIFYIFISTAKARRERDSAGRL
ncbi:undecaprenyl/decaprenyl-phosphate alpha-N-acetylglucosaminyl 1-phosphate transferase [candidate division GN15 bacterium]|nr:undecaprenyl/decaprenyl-phosphate alpha-N-acetylglucosaminyl 1-phosphate transferase [candidate division GN15 bacterium]